MQVQQLPGQLQAKNSLKNQLHKLRITFLDGHRLPCGINQLFLGEFPKSFFFLLFQYFYTYLRRLRAACLLPLIDIIPLLCVMNCLPEGFSANLFNTYSCLFLLLVRFSDSWAAGGARIVMILQQYYFSINSISKNQSNSIKLQLQDMCSGDRQKSENPLRQLCRINLKCIAKARANKTSYIKIKICIIIETKMKTKK